MYGPDNYIIIYAESIPNNKKTTQRKQVT